MTLRLARVKPAVQEVLRRDGFLDRIGEDRTHGNVYRAVETQILDAGGSVSQPGERVADEGTKHS